MGSGKGKKKHAPNGQADAPVAYALHRWSGESERERERFVAAPLASAAAGARAAEGRPALPPRLPFPQKGAGAPGLRSHDSLTLSPSMYRITSGGQNSIRASFVPVGGEGARPLRRGRGPLGAGAGSKPLFVLCRRAYRMYHLFMFCMSSVYVRAQSTTGPDLVAATCIQSSLSPSPSKSPPTYPPQVPSTDDRHTHPPHTYIHASPALLLFLSSLSLLRSRPSPLPSSSAARGTGDAMSRPPIFVVTCRRL